LNVKPVQPRHVQVEHDAARAVIAHGLQKRIAGSVCFDRKAERAQQSLERFADLRIVVDDGDQVG